MEDGGKLPRLSSSAVVSFIQISILSPGAYSVLFPLPHRFQFGADGVHMFRVQPSVTVTVSGSTRYIICVGHFPMTF